MTNHIQFFEEDPYHCVTVIYECGEDIAKLAEFELTRIHALQKRNIKVPSEIRVWDSLRQISVKLELLEKAVPDKEVSKILS